MKVRCKGSTLMIHVASQYICRMINFLFSIVPWFPILFSSLASRKLYKASYSTKQRVYCLRKVLERVFIIYLLTVSATCFNVREEPGHSNHPCIYPCYRKHDTFFFCMRFHSYTLVLRTSYLMRYWNTGTTSSEPRSLKASLLRSAVLCAKKSSTAPRLESLLRFEDLKQTLFGAAVLHQVISLLYEHQTLCISTFFALKSWKFLCSSNSSVQATYLETQLV